MDEATASLASGNSKEGNYVPEIAVEKLVMSNPVVLVTGAGKGLPWGLLDSKVLDILYGKSMPWKAPLHGLWHLSASAATAIRFTDAGRFGRLLRFRSWPSLQLRGMLNRYGQ